VCYDPPSCCCCFLCLAPPTSGSGFPQPVENLWN